MDEKKLCDWIVWVDDDMIFTNSKIKLENIINNYATKKTHLMVTQDSQPAISMLNTGIIFAKNSKKCKTILNNLWEMRDNLIFPKGKYIRWCPLSRPKINKIKLIFTLC